MDIRLKNIEKLINNLKSKELDKVCDFFEKLTDDYKGYDKTIQVISYVFLHGNHTEETNRKFIDELMQATLRNYAEENKVEMLDYMTLAKVVESNLNDMQSSFLYKSDYLKFVKERIDYYNTEEGLNEFCRNNKVSPEVFKNFSFKANFENALTVLTNNEIDKFSDNFVVQNDYKNEVDIVSGGDLEAFRKALINSLETYKFNSYIPAEKLVEKISNMNDAALEKFYSFLEKERLEHVAYHEKEFDKIDAKFQSLHTAYDDERTYYENKLSLEHDLINYYKEGFIKNPEIIQSIFWQDHILKSNIDVGFGRGYNHRTQIVGDLPATKEESIISLKEKLGDIEEGLINEINFPALKDNAEDIMNRIAFYKNMNLYLQTGECCIYKQPYAFYNPKSYKLNSIKLAEQIKEEISDAGSTIKSVQKEFVISNSTIQSLIECKKNLHQEFSTPTGEYQILSGKVGEQEYMFAKEKVYNGGTIENIFYVLPNGNINNAQQLFRVDCLDPASGERTLYHKPIKKQPDVIESVYHIHTYNDIDVIFKNPAKQKGKYELDGVVCDLLGLDDIDKLFDKIANVDNKKYYAESEIEG